MDAPPAGPVSTAPDGEHRTAERVGFLDRLFGLPGRVAVVVGGSSGIGRALAGGLSAAGASVVVAGRDPGRIQDSVRELPGPGAGVRIELADPDGLAAAADAVCVPFGEPDVLVNCAGVNPRPPLAELDRDVWRLTVTVNLEAPFVFGQRVGPAMARRGWGRIVNLASQQTLRAFGNSGAYGVSKAGVAALTRSQAEAWSAFGVCCNALGPGLVASPMTEAVLSEPERAEAMAARTMTGRNGVPADLVGAALFLCSPAAAYVTGQTLFVDGGFSVH